MPNPMVPKAVPRANPSPSVLTAPSSDDRVRRVVTLSTTPCAHLLSLVKKSTDAATPDPSANAARPRPIPVIAPKNAPPSFRNSQPPPSNMSPIVRSSLMFLVILVASMSCIVLSSSDPPIARRPAPPITAPPARPMPLIPFSIPLSFGIFGILGIMLPNFFVKFLGFAREAIDANLPFFLSSFVCLSMNILSCFKSAAKECWSMSCIAAIDTLISVKDIWISPNTSTIISLDSTMGSAISWE